MRQPPQSAEMGSLPRTDPVAMTNDLAPIIIVRPKAYLWLMLPLIAGMSIVLVAWLLAFATNVIAWNPGRAMIIAAWAVIGISAALWCFLKDPLFQRWTLTSTDLRRGRRGRRGRWEPKVVFSFDEVESVVPGLPAEVPRYCRWLRFVSPQGAATIQAAQQVRGATIYVRLHGGRGIALNFWNAWYHNGIPMMHQFVQMHEARIVGQETYTEQELRRLGKPSCNKVFSLHSDRHSARPFVMYAVCAAIVLFVAVTLWLENPETEETHGKKTVTCNGTEMIEGWPEEIQKAQKQTTYMINGKEYTRVRYGDEADDWGADRQPCHDCAVRKGQFHVQGCDVERCPVCGGQVISPCGCDYEGDDE